jgi:hypothetical protein
LSFLDFAHGSAELQPGGLEKLSALTKGLYERPGLDIEIEGSVEPEADREALARRKLESDLRMSKWSALRKSEQAQLKPEEIVVTTEEFEDFVKRTYARSTPQATSLQTNKVVQANEPPTLAAARAGRTTTTEKGAQRMMAQPKAAQAAPAERTRQRLVDIVEITDSDIRELASRRAGRVREYFIQTGKVESERIFFAEVSQGELTSKGSRVNLRLR